jgi:predicted Fe-Mo cluster-binding NifX family protein
VKVILDEMLPAGVARLLSGHEVTTVQRAGYKGLTNGVLIRRAAADGYNVLVTADRNLPAQQNLQASGIAVVLVRGSRMADVAAQAARIEQASPTPRPAPSPESNPVEARLPTASARGRRSESRTKDLG